MDKKIVCMDADIIIKTTTAGSDLLDKIVEVFDKCFLHDYVYNEIKWPEETIIKLDNLIEAGKIELVTDEDLFDDLNNKKFFFETLKQACEIFAIEYNKIYSHLTEAKNKDTFLDLIKIADKKVEGNLGETKTLQMIILFRDLKNEDINYFISDDRRARLGIILRFAQTMRGYKIRGINLMSVFWFLKASGMTKIQAVQYVSNFKSDKSKIYNYDNNMQKLDNKIIIEKLYNDELKLLKIGEFKLLDK